eukprot:gene16104-7458_t
MGRIATGFYYVDTEIGPIGYGQANHFLSLHTVKGVKAAVEQEIACFNSPKLAPRSMSVHLSTVAINCLNSLIWNNANLSTLPDYRVYLVYDHASKKVTYGDSLGWDIPEDLVSRIKMFVDRIYGPDSFNIEVEMCHDPASHRNGRRNCGQGCSKMYPFQTWGHFCGPVAIICPLCPQTCAKKANLVRHIKRLHKDHANVAKQVQTGRCLCLECNQSFRRIVELRDHLSIDHSFIFRTEILEFENRREEKTGKTKLKNGASALLYKSQRNLERSWARPHTINVTEVVPTEKQGQGNAE